MEQDSKLRANFQPFVGDIVTLAQGNDFSRGHVALGGIDSQLAVYALNSNEPERAIFKGTVPSVPSCLTFDGKGVSSFYSHS